MPLAHHREGGRNVSRESRSLQQVVRRVILIASVVATCSLATPVAALAAPATETLPSFVGDSHDQAFAALKAAQLYFSTSGPGSSTSSWTRVVGQLPAAGTVVNLLSTIHLYVTDAPTVTVPPVVHHAVVKPHPVVRRVYAPMADVRGQGRAFTEWVVRHRHFRLVVLRIGPAKGAWNEVLAQHPAPGVRVAAGAQLIITVRRTLPAPTGQKAVPHRSPAVVPTPRVLRNRALVGQATWYPNTPGQCASHYLHFGVRIWVRNTQTGRTITCVISDREASGGLRVVDLSTADFSQLAPLARGVIPVRVWW
jgi:hypothetical protein